jgi:hypothetical protein
MARTLSRTGNSTSLRRSRRGAPNNNSKQRTLNYEVGDIVEVIIF